MTRGCSIIHSDAGAAISAAAAKNSQSSTMKQVTMQQYTPRTRDRLDRSLHTGRRCACHRYRLAERCAWDLFHNASSHYLHNLNVSFASASCHVRCHRKISPIHISWALRFLMDLSMALNNDKRTHHKLSLLTLTPSEDAPYPHVIVSSAAVPAIWMQTLEEISACHAIENTASEMQQ